MGNNRQIHVKSVNKVVCLVNLTPVIAAHAQLIKKSLTTFISIHAWPSALTAHMVILSHSLVNLVFTSHTKKTAS